MAETVYWRKGSLELNFGDYISEYLVDHLFLETARRHAEIRLIGSVLHNSFVPAGEDKPDLIVWGCGIRERGGLDPKLRGRVEILSVRGPISASELGLGTIPQGDPVFLLPALYPSRDREEFADKAICIPHFHDRRNDTDILRESKCDAVLRPNIPSGKENIERFIDAVASSRFVLSASLHGAMVAAAYRRPFAFWHSGAVDLPIKWSDFAASIGIPVGFVRDLAGGEAEYASFANCIKVPSLWTSLTASPYPIRSEALLKVLRYELGFIEGMTMEDMLASRIEGFEARKPYFSRIAAEGRAELNRALAALVERNEQLASVTVELHAARKKYSDLENSRTPAAIVLVTLKTIRRTIRPVVRFARRFRKRVDSSPLLSNDRELLELFDSDWYLKRNPDVKLAGFEPLVHFSEFGAFERRDPHPLFDSNWYLRHNPDVRVRKLNPLLHYLQFGAAEGRSPHPLFDPAWYRCQDPDGLESGANPLLHYLRYGASRNRNPHPLFDSTLYGMNNCGLLKEGVNPLLDYVKSQGKERQSPHPLFDSDWYLRKNPDVVAAGVNPLVHYLKSGKVEGRSPHPLFDANWYLRQNPDVRRAGVEPLIHYWRYGAAEGRNPHPLFDSAFYSRYYPNSPEVRTNALMHYIHVGAAEGRDPHPLFDGRYYRETYLKDSGIENAFLDYLSIGAECGHNPNPVFDAKGYSRMHEDVCRFKGNALVHYVCVGRDAGFQPHPLFDPAWYIENNPAVIPSGIDAYEHFVRFGFREGRLGRAPKNTMAATSG